MTAFVAAPDDTLAAARDAYFAANDFGPNGGYDDAWVDFTLGPLKIPFPNLPARVRAVRMHDLHHTLTGYDTDLFGEFEIAAWEIGSGCAGFVAAWLLNLSAMGTGAFVTPRRTFRAFVRGRRSRNLYRSTYDDALLGRRVGEVRASLDIPPAPPRATAADLAAYAAATAAGAIIGPTLLVVNVPFALVTTVVRAMTA